MLNIWKNNQLIIIRHFLINHSECTFFLMSKELIMYESELCFGSAELGCLDGHLHGWTLLSAVDHWMTWPSWNPWIWGRQNSPSAKCIHCSKASLPHSFSSSGMPCLDLQGHRATTPAKLQLSPSETETSMAREELLPVYTKKLFPDLSKYFMEVWTLPFWIITAQTGQPLTFNC